MFFCYANFCGVHRKKCEVQSKRRFQLAKKFRDGGDFASLVSWKKTKRYLCLS
jgi:hypothetical protein